MNTQHINEARRQQDQFGRRVVARLSTGMAELPHDVCERLRVSRMQAVARRKKAMVPVLAAAGGIELGDEKVTPWQRLASALPMLALVVGLVAIHMVQNERRANEVAEVDAALLTDDLPPAAYADPGFVQFLKTSQ